MPCPKCHYEPTLSELQSSPDKCPSCGVYYAKVAAAKGADIPAAAQSSGHASASKVSFSDWVNANPAVRPAGALILGLVIGYFAGREHVKYEIRTAIQDSFSGISTAFSGLGNSQKPSTLKKPSPAKSTSLLVSARLLDKAYREGEYGRDSLVMDLEFSNNSGSDVRAFDGVVTFTDLLGNEIMAANVAVNDPVNARGIIKWTGVIDYNQFISRHKEFRYSELNNMRTSFNLGKILYADGRQESF